MIFTNGNLIEIYIVTIYKRYGYNERTVNTHHQRVGKN